VADRLRLCLRTDFKRGKVALAGARLRLRLGNKLRTAAKAETKGCARAFRRACDSQPRDRSGSMVVCPALRRCAQGTRFRRWFGQCSCRSNLDTPATSILNSQGHHPLQDVLLTQSCVTHSFLEASAFVLLGPCDLLLEHMSGSKRPVGIAQEFASQQDYVSLPGGDDVLCLFGCGNHAHGSS
jgi:hypothetical protein